MDDIECKCQHWSLSPYCAAKKGNSSLAWTLPSERARAKKSPLFRQFVQILISSVLRYNLVAKCMYNGFRKLLPGYSASCKRSKAVEHKEGKHPSSCASDGSTSHHAAQNSLMNPGFAEAPVVNLKWSLYYSFKSICWNWLLGGRNKSDTLSTGLTVVLSTYRI